MAFFGRAADLAEADGDLDARVAAVLGLARGQEYNLTPGLLPVRLHAAYDATTEPAPRARLAAALARCWSYANEPVRARPFAARGARPRRGARTTRCCWPTPSMRRSPRTGARTSWPSAGTGRSGSTTRRHTCATRTPGCRPSSGG